MSLWGYVSWAVWVALVVASALLRSAAYAIFRGVILAIQTLVVLALLPHLGPLREAYLALHFLSFFDAAVLIFPRLRPTWYRVAISLPAQYMVASTFMAFPWAIVSAFGVTPWGFFVPYVLGLVGLFQSLTLRREHVELVVGQVEPVERVERVAKVSPPPGHAARIPLRIAQITDPHLGPFMPVSRLEAVCERIAKEAPHLVLLTGDFLTMESQRSADDLARALGPLTRLNGRVFACMGNHDHEAPKLVLDALSRIGATMLIDQSAVISTEAGKVQVLGLDFHFRDRKKKITAVCAAHPRKKDCLRLVLLHDPGAFAHVPVGDADLVLSGHTHGGQVGLVSLGRNWTFAGWLAKIPDHGFWGHGTNRLYVHRGTGHYGFPLRLGVPAEESIIFVHSLLGSHPRIASHE